MLCLIFIGTWNGIKQKVQGRKRTLATMLHILVEFLWRRKHFGDIWGGLLKCLKEVNYASNSDNFPIYTMDQPEEGDNTYMYRN